MGAGWDGSLPKKAQHRAWSWGAVGWTESEVLAGRCGGLSTASVPHPCLSDVGGLSPGLGGQRLGRTLEFGFPRGRADCVPVSGTCLRVRSAGPGSVAPSPSSLSLSSLGGCAGQALFSGLKIKASWPGPCWQRGGGGGPAPGLKGIWLEKEASPRSTTSIVGSVGGPPKITGTSASPAMRGTDRAHLGAFCLG